MLLIYLLIALVVVLFIGIIELFIPGLMFYLLIKHIEPIWVWSTILILWFVCRICFQYVSKEKK